MSDEFDNWVKDMWAAHRDIIIGMRNSRNNMLDRAIAIRIMKLNGVDPNEYLHVIP